MKLSPCCSAKIVKRKRYGGQLTFNYCKRCNRRIWDGGKRVTREQAQKFHAGIIGKINSKHKKREKFMEIFIRTLTERALSQDD